MTTHCNVSVRSDDIPSMAILRADTVAPTFESFFRDEHDRLVRLAHLLTGSHEIAEELVQEAMLAAHTRWENLENPPGYVRRALVNLSRSHHRRQTLERRALPP